MHVRGAVERRGRARRGAQGGRLHARPVLALRRGPLLGAHRLRARIGRHALRHRPGLAWPTGHRGVRRRRGRAARRRRRSPPTWRAGTSRSTATSASARGRRWSSGRTSATATSTRTGRRHDGARCATGAAQGHPGPEGGGGEDGLRAGGGAALHPSLLGQDRRRQVRRQRPARGGRRQRRGRGRGRPRLLRRGRGAHAGRRHAARRRARWRPPDRRADGAARQGDRVPQRAAGHRRGHARHRPHGAGRQGEPRHRLRHQRARPAGRRHVRRGRQPDHGRPDATPTSASSATCRSSTPPCSSAWWPRA